MKIPYIAALAALLLSTSAHAESYTAQKGIDIEKLRQQIEENQPAAKAAKEGVTASLTPAQKATVNEIEKYLTNLTTITADFMQASPEGDISTGKFYLQRPGKMRWQYNPPTPILMVARANTLTFYDYELKQVTNVPLDETLGGFLAQEHISFDGDVKLTNFEERPGAVSVTMIQTKRPKDGSLTLEFSLKPLQIRNMIITDATNQVTNVSLSNAKFGLKLDRSLFIFEAPGRRNR